MAKVKFNFGKIVGLSTLVIALAVGVALTQQNQNFKEKASGICPMTPQCPGSDGALRSCYSSGGIVTKKQGGIVAPGYIYIESKCDKDDKVSVCDGKSYCCPVAGGAWTTDLSKCDTYSTSGNSKRKPITTPVGTPIRVEVNSPRPMWTF